MFVRDRKREYNEEHCNIETIEMNLYHVIINFFRYTVTVKVSEQKPYTERTKIFCWSLPPTCSKYKIIFKNVVRNEVRFTLYSIHYIVYIIVMPISENSVILLSKPRNHL